MQSSSHSLERILEHLTARDMGLPLVEEADPLAHLYSTHLYA